MNNNRRILKERSGAGSGSQPPRNSGGRRARAGGGGGAAATSSRSKVGKGSPQKVREKNEHKKSISSIPCCSGSASLGGNDKFTTTNSQIGTDQHNICSAPPQEAGCSTSANHTSMNTATMAAEKSANGSGGGGGGGDFVNECPRVVIPLTGKEKEEDFLAMKGTKLPHRPKKRPKTVDRMLQYCFPGMWLSDVSRARYEVKEKKCTTKKTKRRGLKGMESMDSYSE